jgi:predicted membrane chloride channel (bestrophin family)
LTVPLVAFTAFALFGIEGASNECEIPFDRSRPNHLAIDAYCLVILDAIQGLVVHDANVDMSEKQNECNEEEGAVETTIV